MRVPSTDHAKPTNDQHTAGEDYPADGAISDRSSSAHVRLHSLQRAVAHSLFLLTVVTGVVTTRTGVAVAYSPETIHSYPDQTLTVDSAARFEGLQAQFPGQRDRVENRRDRQEDYRRDEVRRCLEKRDRDDREDCLEDLKRDRERNRDWRLGGDDARRCFEKRDEDDRRRCLQDLRNRRRGSERDRLERRDDVYNRRDRDRWFPF